jgi:NitT/TauT family transport system permease protein
MIRDKRAPVRYWSAESAKPSADRGALVALSLVTGLLVWQLAATLVHSNVTLPSALAVGEQFVEGLRSGELLRHCMASLLRIVAGFMLGSAIGVVLGLLIGASVTVRALLEPITSFLRFIPPICWISPFLIWFGIDETSKVLIITYTVTFMVLLSTTAGIANVSKNKVRAARCLGAGQVFVFVHVVLPSLARDVRLGMRVGLSNAFTTIITAEMIAAQSGLGVVILNSRNFGATDLIILAMLCLGIMGFMVDRLFETASRSLLARYLRA